MCTQKLRLGTVARGARMCKRPYLDVAEGQARPGTFTTSGAVGISTANVRKHTTLMSCRRKTEPKRNMAWLKYLAMTGREAKKFRSRKIAEGVHNLFVTKHSSAIWFLVSTVAMGGITYCFH